MSTKDNIVRSVIDTNNPPKLSAKAKARLLAIRDEDIDLSDIPESPSDAKWVRAAPIKQQE